MNEPSPVRWLFPLALVLPVLAATTLLGACGGGGTSAPTAATGSGGNTAAPSGGTGGASATGAPGSGGSSFGSGGAPVTSGSGGDPSASASGGSPGAGTGGATTASPGTGGETAAGSGGNPGSGNTAGTNGTSGTGARSGGTGGVTGKGGGPANPGAGSGGAGGGGNPVTVPPGCTIPATVSYTKDVQPFLITSCGGGNGCHVIDAMSTMGSGGYDHGYDWITAGAHASSCPNKPTPERFQVVLDVIAMANPASCSKSRIMPPAGSGKTALTACQIATLASWLNEPLVTQMHRADDSSPTTPYPMPPYN